MRFKSSFAAALAAFLLGPGAAFAWDDAYRGDPTNNPNSDFLMHSYPTAANYCPAGLQPVTLGGRICCGTPNAGPYINRAGGHATHKSAHRSHAAPRAYAPVGEKGVYFN